MRRLGGIACGNFGLSSLGGLGRVNLGAQLICTTMGVVWALAGGFVVYGVLKPAMELRLSGEVAFEGADLSIHKIDPAPHREARW